MITEIEDFYTLGCGRCPRFQTADCSVQAWNGGLRALRAICLGLGLSEHVKWGHPTFMHAGRNIAVMGGFRGDFRLSFMNASLLQDHDGILQRQGAATRSPDMICFTHNDAPSEMETQISALVRQAMGYAEAGIVPPKVVREVDLPEVLITALDDDPELAEAFFALTPGRQRSYVINLNAAKAEATKQARIVKFRPHILAGKGALER